MAIDFSAARATNLSTRGLTLKGSVKPVGQKVIVNAEWGTIYGEIENQDDLMIELHERDNDALSVQEIEKILYLD